MPDITILKRIDANSRIYLTKTELEALQAAPGDLVEASLRVKKHADGGRV